MKKKQRCLFKRFAALVAALVISFSFPVSALAASDTVADMPSDSDFLAHRGSWFVWRTFDVRSASGDDAPYYELCSSPIFSIRLVTLTFLVLLVFLSSLLILIFPSFLIQMNVMNMLVLFLSL